MQGDKEREVRNPRRRAWVAPFRRDGPYSQTAGHDRISPDVVAYPEKLRPL
jgi:hypothetical protein